MSRAFGPRFHLWLCHQKARWRQAVSCGFGCDFVCGCLSVVWQILKCLQRLCWIWIVFEINVCCVLIRSKIKKRTMFQNSKIRLNEFYKIVFYSKFITSKIHGKILTSNHFKLLRLQYFQNQICKIENSFKVHSKLIIILTKLNSMRVRSVFVRLFNVCHFWFTISFATKNKIHFHLLWQSILPYLKI